MYFAAITLPRREPQLAPLNAVDQLVAICASSEQAASVSKHLRGIFSVHCVSPEQLDEMPLPGDYTVIFDELKNDERVRRLKAWLAANRSTRR
jgi:hypothetical protein